MAVKLGMNGKLYYNTSVYATPTWVVMATIKDVTINLERDVADVTTRANNGWKASVGTLTDGSVEFEALWDKEDAGFAIFKNAFFKNTSIEVAVMDGDITAPPSEGLRATCIVSNFTRTAPLTDAYNASITLMPTPATNAPYWYESGACLATETTTSAGENVYWDVADQKVTFDDDTGSNAFIGVSVENYTTLATIIYFDSTADEVT